MSAQEEIDAREEARLSRALTGKLGTQQPGYNKNGRVQSWAPVVTKPVATVPVNYSGAATGGGVDTDSPYSNVVNVPISDEKLRQEQARLKKWGLDSAFTNGNQVEHSSNNSTPLVSPSSTSQHVDSTPIVTNIDGTTNEDKIRQEQARLKRWGFNIGSSSSSSSTPSSTPSNNGSTVSQPSSTVSPRTATTAPASTVPASPNANGAANSVASQYGLPVQTVQPFLSKIISAGKSVKLILHKKSTNHDVAIAIMLDLVKESAEFGLQLPNDLPISFDISQASGRLAVAVNELVNAGASHADPAKIQQLYEDIQAQIGLLYLGVTAN